MLHTVNCRHNYKLIYKQFRQLYKLDLAYFAFYFYYLSSISVWRIILNLLEFFPTAHIALSGLVL